MTHDWLEELERLNAERTQGEWLPNGTLVAFGDYIEALHAYRAAKEETPTASADAGSHTSQK